MNWLETVFADSDYPLVIVGMPIYNGASTLPFALDSLLAQTYKNFQIFISDNASTDETREICERYQKGDKRIRYHRQEQNMGMLHNFNYVLQIAESPLFMWAAHDDQWEPDFIKDLVNLLKSNPAAVLSFCAFDNNEPFLGSKTTGGNLSIISNRRSPFSRSAVLIIVSHGRQRTNMMYGIMPTALVKSIGGFSSIFNTEKGIKEYLWYGDNHFLFSLGLRGGFVTSDRILFHKGYRSDYFPAKDEYPTLKDILTSCDIYRIQISRSGLPLYQQLILQLCALINATMLLARRGMVITLDRMKLLFFFRRIRRSFASAQYRDDQFSQKR